MYQEKTSTPQFNQVARWLKWTFVSKLLYSTILPIAGILAFRPPPWIGVLLDESNSSYLYEELVAVAISTLCCGPWQGIGNHYPNPEWGFEPGT